MTAAHNMWFTPIRFSATSYVLRVTANGTTSNLTFPATGSLDREADFWMVDDGSATSLLTLLELCLEDHSEIGTAATVALNLSGGGSLDTTLVSITSDVTTQILWTHGSTTLDKAIFGFTGDSASSTSLAGTVGPKGFWRPRRGVYVDSRDRLQYVGGTTRSLSGVQRTVANAVSRKSRSIAYRYLHKRYCLDEYAISSEPYNTFEQFQRNSIFVGRSAKFCESEDTRTAPVEYRHTSQRNTLEIMSEPNLIWWQADLDLVRASA
jgi:hypothetical protein